MIKYFKVIIYSLTKEDHASYHCAETDELKTDEETSFYVYTYMYYTDAEWSQ